MLENLNDKQIEAIKHKEGPLLILAGAGSGKTKVLTTRIAYLIKEYNVLPNEILAITFTNKAAKEMKDRINSMVNSYVLACTFHSFGVRILRENYSALGYDKNFNILDSEDTISVIKKILKKMNIDFKQFSPYMIKNKISYYKTNLILPNEVSDINLNEESVINLVYKKYQLLLKENNSVDFDDLIVLPILLFRNNPDILSLYQERYKYLLVDEYQDTNHVQYLLIKMLSAKYKNICVVGDQDQSIYAFRGANYKNILNFEKDYKNAKVVFLEQNYRSTKLILDAANSVIKNNTMRKEKNLWSSKITDDKISLYKAYDERDEAFYCIRKIKELIKQGVSYKDIAILYRTNAQSRVFEQELLKENLPFKIIGSFYFYNRKEIKDLIAYLKLINNTNDNISFLRSINFPKRGIGEKSIGILENKSIEEGISLFDSVSTKNEVDFKNMILELKEESQKLSLTEFIDLVLDKSGIRNYYIEEKTLDADIRLENLEEFKSVTKTFEEEKGVASLEDFLLEISLVSDIEEYKNDNNRISLMTVHAVKGLEFPFVFITGLEEGIFPHRNSYEQDKLEEERRLMYVAVTRAKEKLFITSTIKRMIYGKEIISVQSRFINEIDNDLISFENKKAETIVKKEKQVYEKDQEFFVGEKINHDQYGLGVIVEINKSIITVAFNNKVGVKKLLKNHKSIKKI